jgi:hypothetical protein
VVDLEETDLAFLQLLHQAVVLVQVDLVILQNTQSQLVSQDKEIVEEVVLEHQQEHLMVVEVQAVLD